MVYVSYVCDCDVMWWRFVVYLARHFYDCNMGICIVSLYRLRRGNVNQVWLENEKVRHDERFHDQR
jgi:hypothetical protein